MKSGLNWYGYVNNNPLKYIDPSGHSPALYEIGVCSLPDVCGQIDWRTEEPWECFGCRSVELLEQFRELEYSKVVIECPQVQADFGGFNEALNHNRYIKEQMDKLKLENSWMQFPSYKYWDGEKIEYWPQPATPEQMPTCRKSWHFGCRCC